MENKRNVKNKRNVRYEFYYIDYYKRNLKMIIDAWGLPFFETNLKINSKSHSLTQCAKHFSLYRKNVKSGNIADELKMGNFVL